MRVHSGDVCFLESAGERLEPALGLPLVRIGAPEFLVSIARRDVCEDPGTLLDRDGLDERAVHTSYGSGKRQNAILASAV